ncbi:hypothetical protein PSPO01_15733 [Paraphaeosphaeria sporulosa]
MVIKRHLHELSGAVGTVERLGTTKQHAGNVQKM